MKAKLEFDLDDHYDKISHLRCVKSLDMAIALWDIEQLVLEREDEEDETLDGLRIKIFNVLGNIEINDLINE